ncbi:MAG: hypothetical protein IJ264_04830 [Clostridia bacterium]|nr:hypothetical protein [Clostridia bacterium]
MRRVILAVLLLLVLGGCVKTVGGGFSAPVTQETTYDFSALTEETTERRTTGTESTAENNTSVSETEKAVGVESTKRITTTKRNITEYSTAAKTTQKKETTTNRVTTTKSAETTARPSEQSEYAVIIGIKSVRFGCTKQDIINAFGSPDEIITENGASEDAFESLVYCSDYGDFAVFQLCGDSFGGFYTVDKSTIVTDGKSSYSLRSGGSTEFGDIGIELFKDSISGGRAYALWAKIDGFAYVPEKFRDVSGQERLIFHLANSLRALNGVSPLQYSDSAANCARLHCEDMINREYFAHDTPEGITPAERMKQSGIDYSSCGENIASGFDSPFHFTDGWYNSSGHRKNILDKSYKYLGVGAVSAGGASIYIGQNFYG